MVIQMTQDAGCSVIIASLGYSSNADDKLVSEQASAYRDPSVMER